MSTIIGLVSTFRLPLHFPLLQRPIRRTTSTILDFLMPSRLFNVQSAAPPAQFWTSSCLCTSQQKVDTTLYFYTSFNEHNTPYTVLESDNSESMPDVLH